MSSIRGWLIGAVTAVLTGAAGSIVAWYLTERDAAEPVLGPHTLRTGNLGIQLVQDDRPLPLFEGEENYRYSVTLRRRPFEIRVPERNWRDRRDEYPALQLAVSDDPALLSVLQLDAEQTSTNFLTPGTGMADSMHGSGQLFLSTADSEFYGHNHIVGGRFNTSSSEYRGVYVSSIYDPDHDVEIFQKAAELYFVFYMNIEADGSSAGFGKDTVSRFEVDIVRAAVVD